MVSPPVLTDAKWTSGDWKKIDVTNIDLLTTYERLPNIFAKDGGGVS